MRPIVLLVALVASASASAAEPDVVVPPENAAKGALPSLAGAEELAKRLLAAITADAPGDVEPLFFPRAPFLALKAIPKAGDYHAKLVAWFEDDLKLEHDRVKGLGPLEFDGFKAGGCKWKDAGTEYNKIAYWSCYRSRFFAKGGRTRLTFPLATVINWGPSWYVTHLRPPR